MRGRFDYASLNSSKIEDLDKFSIFIMSDELGIKLYLYNIN